MEQKTLFNIPFWEMQTINFLLVFADRSSIGSLGSSAKDLWDIYFHLQYVRYDSMLVKDTLAIQLVEAYSTPLRGRTLAALGSRCMAQYGHAVGRQVSLLFQSKMLIQYSQLDFHFALPIRMSPLPQSQLCFSATRGTW